AGITYGTALSGTQLNATVAGVSGGSAAGALTYSPVSGTVLNGGDWQALTVSAAATTNYCAASKTVHIDVAKAALTVTADSDTATSAVDHFTRFYGDANPAFTVRYSGFVNGETLGTSGVTGTPSETTTATATSSVGAYAVTT